MMMLSRIRTGERGSIPLVLLAAIVLGGVVVILFGIVRSGQISVRADRDFANAVHVADAGIQQAYAQMRTLDEGENLDEKLSCGDASEPCTGALGDGTSFEWTYKQTGPASYQVESHGMAGDEKRILTTTVEADLEFVADITAFSTLSMSGIQPNPKVSIATYCNADISGAVTDGISRLTLINWDAENCDVSSSPPAALDDIPTETASRPPLTDRASDFCSPLAEIKPEDPPEDEFWATPDGVEFWETLPEELDRGTTYCARRSRSTHTLSELGSLTGAAREVKVYFYDESYTGNVISLAGGHHWNWPNPTPADLEATDLQIWIADGGGDVRLVGNSRMAATINAPFSTCVLRGNNNSRFRGAVFCNNVETRGNFSPDALAQGLRDGPLNIQGIDEQFLPS